MPACACASNKSCTPKQLANGMGRPLIWSTCVQSANKGIDEAANKLLAELPRATADIQSVAHDASILAHQVAQASCATTAAHRTPHAHHPTLSAFTQLHVHKSVLMRVKSRAKNVYRTLKYIQRASQLCHVCFSETHLTSPGSCCLYVRHVYICL
jgi:hypothetical protein